jgi:NAD(P)-dependent dehydrogenase (short-subunit alcohol dehydrogenase family)
MSKFVVVTGGSRGIGKAVITKFTHDGWQAINLSRTNCDIAGVINLNVDLYDAEWSTSKGDALIQLVKQASQICLVHNASTFNKDDITTLDAAEFRKTLEFNLISTQTLNTLLIPNMQRGSAIIYVGSTLSEMAVASRASYVISKHALVGMMRVTCQDLQGKGITTCCVCPGFVNTGMVTDHVEKTVLDQFIQSKVTAGRLIEPAEIAEFIYFCALNPVINGAVLHANLGQISS